MQRQDRAWRGLLAGESGRRHAAAVPRLKNLPDVDVWSPVSSIHEQFAHLVSVGNTHTLLRFRLL